MLIDSTIIKLIAHHTGLSVADILPTKKLAEDLDMDSLDCLELVMSVEKEFELEIEDELAEKFKTVQDIIDHVQREVSGVAA